MTYHFDGPPRTCKNKKCGKTYTPKSHSQKFCSPKCKGEVTSAKFKERNPEYFRGYFEQRKKNTTKIPNALKPPFNPKPCFWCKKPLGNTWNQWYHPDCHHRASKSLTGIEEVYVSVQI